MTETNSRNQDIIISYAKIINCNLRKLQINCKNYSHNDLNKLSQFERRS